MSVSFSPGFAQKTEAFLNELPPFVISPLRLYLIRKILSEKFDTEQAAVFPLKRALIPLTTVSPLAQRLLTLSYTNSLNKAVLAIVELAKQDVFQEKRVTKIEDITPTSVAPVQKPTIEEFYLTTANEEQIRSAHENIKALAMDTEAGSSPKKSGMKKRLQKEVQSLKKGIKQQKKKSKRSKV